MTLLAIQGNYDRPTNDQRTDMRLRGEATLPRVNLSVFPLQLPVLGTTTIVQMFSFIEDIPESLKHIFFFIF